MTIRQQYANDELLHKLRSMLNDLPTLRSRAIKKLEYWREAAIKQLLNRQRELEKTLVDKFERLQFDTQLFVENTERKKTQHDRRWQSEPIDFLNKSEIDRISMNLRAIREELEQSKLILIGPTISDHMGKLLSDKHLSNKFAQPPRYGETLSSKTSVHSTSESSSTNDLGVELERVLDICTSPQSSTIGESTSLQSLDHAEYSHDAQSKQTTNKTNTTVLRKRPSQAEDKNRRHARLITNVPNDEQQQTDQEEKSTTPPPVPPAPAPSTPPIPNNHKLFAFETFDDSIRRFQRLREIRKNLRNKYDENNSDDQQSTSNNDEKKPIDIPIERIIQAHTENTNVSPPNRKSDANISPSHKQPNVDANVKMRDRKYRSRTLESNQIRSSDHPPSGRMTLKGDQHAHHRSGSHRHRKHHLLIRRSSDDAQDQQSKFRRNIDSADFNANNTWLEVGRENWVNLLENGWRPTIDTPSVNLVSLNDSSNESQRHTQEIGDRMIVDPYGQVSRTEYSSMFEQLDYAYARTIDLGNEFWRFLEIYESQYFCLYHQINKQFIMYKPDISLLCFPWPYDGILDISWSKIKNLWVVATQTQIIICNCSFSKVLQSVEIAGEWPKRITSCRSSIFHTYKIPNASNASSYRRLSYKERPQFLLERYDYKLNSVCKHILESSTIWDVEADDLTEHVAVLCDVALLLFDYQLNLVRRIEVTGFKVSKDHFGGWLIADYNGSCIWQIRRNEYLTANKILHVERPWTVIADETTWSLATLSETQKRAKRLLFFNMKNIPKSLMKTDISSAQSQLSTSSSSSSISESII